LSKKASAYTGFLRLVADGSREPRCGSVTSAWLP
jgi:hypothetical protein